MSAAQWNRELVADLLTKGARLGEFEVVGIGRGLLADQARLFADKQQMRLAALAERLLRMGEPSLVGRRQSWLQRRLGPRSRGWPRLFRRFHGGRLVDHVGCETGSVLQLALIGVRVPADRDHGFQAIVITHSRTS